jgi:sensor histidine kinase YesM
MKKILQALFATFVYNTAIAGLLTAVGWMSSTNDYGFWCNFGFSQSIGFSIAIISSLTLARMPPGRLRWAALCLVLPISIAVGLSIGFKVTGVGSWSDSNALAGMVVGLFFGIIASITFVLIERIEILNKHVRERELQAVEQEKRALEAQLKMLQAQIEPHFLFNTLANVGSLIDSDPPLAKKLLERLNDWLRVALLRARNDHTTLGDELDMLENYLQILHIRFGDRLCWTIEADAAVRGAKFPPMLLQPLVENAVRHGIEPKLGGGGILISANLENARLHIVVSDTGIGLQANSDKDGAGLTNVRARLATLFGDSGKLVLLAHENGGAIATLELPI